MAEDERILPVKGERNVLITSALPYVNNVPHLGNIVGSVLSADVFSRYNKARGRPTLFVCGTDEYGTATETKALEEKITPRQLCDKYYDVHADVYKWFNIGFDIFGRTSTQQGTDITQDIFRRLYTNGSLVERESLQPYCVGEGGVEHGFLADRFIEGICPKCGYDDARGDQCDKCGSVDYEPLDLKNAHCKVHANIEPVARETRHIHIRLDKLQPAIEQWFNKAHQDGFWSKNGQVITKSWLKEGLRERGITRDFKWGIPVPLDVFNDQKDRDVYKDKVFYVWFDACIGYVSITANYTAEWERWWRDPDNVSLYQFMGKDNVPFHTVMFPASQIGSKQKWTMLHHLSTTEYLTYEGGKFSKSRGVGVFGNNAKDTGVPADVWRYYLLKQRPETADTQFDWKDFIARNNNELLAKLGNLVNRVIKLVNSKLYNSTVPDYTKLSPSDKFDETKLEINKLLQKYNEQLEAVRLKDGLQTAIDITQEGNNFIQSNRLDNKLVANEPDLAAAVVGLAINIIQLCASIFEPYLPATSQSIIRQLKAPFLLIPDQWTGDDIKPGHQIGKAEYLFALIDPKKENEWREKYGGDQEGKMKQAEEAARKKAQKAADKARKAAKKAAKNAQGQEDLNGKPPEKLSVESTAVAGAAPTDIGTEPVDSVTDGWANPCPRTFIGLLT